MRTTACSLRTITRSARRSYGRWQRDWAPGFTIEVKAAWEAAYALLAELMQQAAAQVPTKLAA